MRPDLPGLEVVLLEEGRNYVVLLGLERGVLWWTTNQRQEPQNAVVGEFDPARPGLEIWCRSRYDTHQKPWVLDAQGAVVARYEMDQVAPPGWTAKSVEEIVAIHWTGASLLGPACLALAISVGASNAAELPRIKVSDTQSRRLGGNSSGGSRSIGMKRVAMSPCRHEGTDNLQSR